MNQTKQNKEQNNSASNPDKPKKIFVLAKPPDRTKAQSSNVLSSPSIHSLRSPNKIQKTVNFGKTGIPITVYIAPSASKSNNSGANSVEFINDIQHNPTATQSNDTSRKNIDLLQNPNEQRKSSISQITTNFSSVTKFNPKKLVKWNRNACLLLAETYKMYENEFSATHTRKKRVWEKISRLLNVKYGLGVNSTQCENKMRSILYSHQRVSDNKKPMEIKVVNQFSLQNLEELQFEEDFIDNPVTHVTPECISLDAPENKTPCNDFQMIAEKSPSDRKVKLTRRDKIRRDKEVRLLINNVTNGMERRHKEKMAKCDKMIEILGKIVDKF